MGRPDYIARDDAKLAVHDCFDGLPVLFQHGLGGDEAQAAQTFPDARGFRRITVECRGHGASSFGSIRPFSIEMFAEDVLAAAKDRGIDRPVVGGVSMGAAIALHLAHRYPAHVAALILVRPAWTFTAAPENMAPALAIASLMQSHPLDEAKRRFLASDMAARFKANAPDNFVSLTGYFDRPDPTAFASILAGIASDGPGVSQTAAATLAVPTLIIGNEQDAIHPMSSAQTLASTIPGATFVEVTAKAADKPRHFAEIHEAISQFLAPKAIRSLVKS